MSTLQGLPGASPALRSFVQMVRLFHRDFPELNRLVAGEESSDRQIAWAVLDAISDFNGTPPFLGNATLESLLGMNQQSLLLRMTTIALLESVALLQTRNHLPYSAGGVNVAVNDKAPMLMNWLQYFKASTDQMKQRVKVAMNIGAMLGVHPSGLHSEYWAVNQTYAVYTT